nr:benzoate/H(+) symporter BenE family transporter [Klebsiella aerogenes]
MYAITHNATFIVCYNAQEVFMRSFTLPIPTLLAGFVAVLVGYASSAAIIWQAAATAGADAGQIAGWMTALGLAMGVSTLVLTLWRKVPILTAWSTPGAALLVSGLQGATLAQAVGIFVFANALILLCGVTGLFARLMKIIPHSLAAAMLAGILLRFGLQAFSGLQDNLLLCGGMFAAWLLCKALYPRFAVVAALAIGGIIALLTGALSPMANDMVFVAPRWITPQFTPSLLLSVGVPFFLVTMASQNAPGLATIQASGYRVPVSPLIVFTGALALLFSPFGVYSVCIAAITAAICQSPDAHPDAGKRWLAAAAAGFFYLVAGLFGGSITALMAALPPVWIQMLAGLALLGTISGSLYQALGNENERDAAVVTFLVTSSGVSLAGVGSAFWGLVIGGISYMLLTTLRRA